jgi:hypothetical protein
MNLLPTIIANAARDDWRAGRLVYRNRLVPWWVQEVKVGNVKQGCGPGSASAAKDATALSTMLYTE